MRRLTGLVAAGAALAALIVPALALGAPLASSAGGTSLQEAPDSAFPDRVYVLQLSQRKALTARDVKVTENGQPVIGLAVETPGAASSGAILLIDASNSMHGAPIQNAMKAARAFLAARKIDLPVSILVFNASEQVLSGFTTSSKDLEAAVSKTPALGEGTHIYDALVQAAGLAKKEGLTRSTVVLLSDGTDVGSSADLADALNALKDAHVRVVSVGLKSPQYDPETLKEIAHRTVGTYVESATPKQLSGIFSSLGTQLSNQYIVTYRSLLPPKQQAVVKVDVPTLGAATAKYTTPALVIPAHGSFNEDFYTRIITSAWLMVFVIASVLALLGFAVLTALDVRNRSVKRRMAKYVTIPSEEESRQRRAEVAALLAEPVQKRLASTSWWRSFEADVELAGFSASAVTIAGWTLIGGILASIVAAFALQSLWALLIGFVAPFVTRVVVSRKVTSLRNDFAEQLPDNLEVIAGALRAGHSLIGAMNVMVEDAAEPSKTEFRRVMQDEQLGVPIDEALQVMARRMNNPDVDQVALVTRLQREAGGNTAEVLDRVIDNIRGRMELRRLIQVLTTQNRFARWILISIPIAVLVLLLMSSPGYLSPLFNTTVGIVALVAWAIMLIAGSIWIKRITEMEV